MPKGKRPFRGSMRAAFAACVIVSGSAGIAHAQWFQRYYQPPVVMDELTPREAVQRVLAQGYSKPSRPIYEDDVVVLSATEPSGRRVRLVLDVYSGRIIDSITIRTARPARPHEQVVQRAPDQGPTIRRSVPDPVEPTRATPERPATIRREPMLPPQTTTPVPSRPRVVAPETPQAPARPPEASVGTGTKDMPRRIEMVPPAALDAPPAPTRPPAGPPINSVPPAALE
jgi:hypothetical protein